MARLVPVGGWASPLTLAVDTPMVIGRNSPPAITDKRISRRQVEVRLDGATGAIAIRRLGQNPCFVARASGTDEELGTDETRQLKHGDTLFLVQNEFAFTVEIKAPPAQSKKRPAGGDDDDKTDTEDNDAIPAWTAAVSTRRAAARRRPRSDDGSGVSGDDDDDGADDKPTKPTAIATGSTSGRPRRGVTTTGTQSQTPAAGRPMPTSYDRELDDFDDTGLVPCRYGAGCYQRSTLHFKSFMHPLDHPVHSKKQAKKTAAMDGPTKKIPASSNGITAEPKGKAPTRSASKLSKRTASDDDAMDSIPAPAVAPTPSLKPAKPTVPTPASVHPSAAVTLSVPASGGFVDDEEELVKPALAPTTPLARPSPTLLRKTTSLLRLAETTGLPLEDKAEEPVKASSASSSTSSAPAAVSVPPKPAVSLEVSPISTATASRPQPTTTSTPTLVPPTFTRSKGSILGASVIPYISLPLLGVANGVPADTVAAIAVEELAKLDSELPKNHRVIIHFIVDDAAKNALDRALQLHPELARWVQLDDATLDSLPSGTNYMVVEVTWRFKPVTYIVNDLVGGTLSALFDDVTNHAAQIGVVYNRPILASSPWATMGVREILALKVPNYNNPKKPDLLTDLDQAKAELIRAYDGLIEQVRGWSAIATVDNTRSNKGKEKAIADDDEPTPGSATRASASAGESKGSWSKVLLQYIDHPNLHRQQTFDSDEHTVTIFDKFPKARTHLLVIPRKHIAWLKDLTREHVPLIKHMMDLARSYVTKLQLSTPGRMFNIGFHAAPSMQQIHLHVISRDFDSPALKDKKHWNSFTSKFFLPVDDVLQMLERTGSVKIDESQYEALLKGPLKCPQCLIELATIPKAKEHMKTHDFK